jgi:hypothetical protein
LHRLSEAVEGLEALEGEFEEARGLLELIELEFEKEEREKREGKERGRNDARQGTECNNSSSNDSLQAECEARIAAVSPTTSTPYY